MLKREKELTKNKAKENIKEISSQSSIHGLPNILNSKYVVFKLIWLICFAMSISYCSYLLVQMVISYFNYDKIVKIKYLSDYNMDFPAIVICDFLPLNRSLDQLLLNCSFNNEPCNMSYFGIETSIIYGVCNSFNMFKQKLPVLKPTKAGISFGLSLDLFAGLPSNAPSSIAISGLAVAIYNSSSRPTFSEDIVRVRPSQETSMMIGRQVTHKLSYPYSNCIKNVTDPLAFDSTEYRNTFNDSRVYKQKICISLCTMNLKSKIYRFIV